MQKRHKIKESQEAVKTIYRLRQQGWIYQQSADETGERILLVIRTAKREHEFRCKAFEYPFLEYIATRSANGIRKASGISILGEPEKLFGIEQVKALMCWPGMKDKVMRVLAEGLAGAGYESFEPGKMKAAIFTTKRQEQRMRRERVGCVKD